MAAGGLGSCALGGRGAPGGDDRQVTAGKLPDVPGLSLLCKNLQLSPLSTHISNQEANGIFVAFISPFLSFFFKDTNVDIYLEKKTNF